MKGLRFLLLGMAICLASGVKAQFYDSADDIYYYLEYKHEYTEPQFQGLGYNTHVVLIPRVKNYSEDDNYAEVVIFNFDGKKAAVLGCDQVYVIKHYMKSSSTYFEDKVETTEYGLKYESSTSNTVYTTTNYTPIKSYSFSNDRSSLIISYGNEESYDKHYYKKVDKSFFKVGRSRTPSGTMHE